MINYPHQRKRTQEVSPWTSPFLDKLRKIDVCAGEQPKTDNIIKLNANENPYPPAPGVTEVLRTFDAAKLAIYPDANAKGAQNRYRRAV